MLPTRAIPTLLFGVALAIVPAAHTQQTADSPAASPANSPAAERALRHASPEWQLVEPHLPDPATASAAKLETQGDVLRARRFPEDAIEFYGYALARGGDAPRLYTSIAVAQLEMHHPEIARLYLKRALDLKKKNAQAWNDLGAAEFMAGDPRGSIADYQHAVKLNRKNAIFHANLGTSYFELGDYDSARQQYQTALRLDHEVFNRGGWGGSQIEVMSHSDRGRFCFEMARLAAQQAEDAAVIEWLGKSAEAGYELRNALASTKELAAYRSDPRVTLLIRNAQAMRARQIAAAPVPPLPSAKAPR